MESVEETVPRRESISDWVEVEVGVEGVMMWCVPVREEMTWERVEPGGLGVSVRVKEDRSRTVEREGQEVEVRRRRDR